jgi:hypothetical protein
MTAVSKPFRLPPTSTPAHTATRHSMPHLRQRSCPPGAMMNVRTAPALPAGGRTWTQCHPEQTLPGAADRRPAAPGAVAYLQLVAVPPGRPGYDCLVEGSQRGAGGGSLRPAAALLPSSPDAPVGGQSDVARARAGSRVTAGPFAGHSDDARALAVSV